MTFYLKYRPQTLQDLDISEVRESLLKIMSTSHIPHAFLFSGPKGTGKTSGARIIAKILNCQNLQKNSPCDKCDSCLGIRLGRFMDVMEIDAASNRGIDEIRDLREKIRLAPVSGKNKVYIIDEVHMLTNEAFNALLKTLEEPPAHVTFVLATTEPDKLPPTIISRCVRFNFRKAKDEEIVHALERVCSGEKLKIEREVLSLIATHSDGSFRDATKILEQAISENALTPEKLKTMIGRDGTSVARFMELMRAKTTAELLTEIETMEKQGKDFKFLISGILDFLHALLLCQFGVLDDKFFADSWTDKFEVAEINTLIRLFSRVYTDMKYSYSPALTVQLAVVEWCSTSKSSVI